ncbi:MAG TPA: amylo-alpha-1,6-glucosidase [Lachnoclostridium phocaeense]|uniref:Amylo-alpha-1,6-glucosidase n=1 Tax=Lachnoclostridium phocaeense TaxID=1871021 RepID=A0A921I208_9FIRM|nr:amylo-alpha-1,6-glucosidase [Lachnoclostridium phocaeense]
MKWIYGRQDFKTVERSEETCYLMTNGLGGFSSLTAAGAAARNDHAFFMACVRSPNSRYNIIHRLREQVGDTVLSTQEMADGSGEAGYRYLSSFTWEDTPVWHFQADGVEIRKEAAMEQGENTIALRYEIANRSREARTFLVTPFYQFSPKGEDLDPGREPAFADGKITGEAGTLVFRTNGHDRKISPEKETYYYRYDACDGRRERGSAVALHQMGMTVPTGEERVLEVVWHLETPGETFVFPGAREVVERAKQFRQELSRKAGFQDEMADVLVKSAAQFVSERASTEGKTILAGFPFFEDWGRDTMIALPGVCLSTGQYDTAKDILRTFAAYEKDGLMPNLFPEGENEPLYNTVDAALLFINCVWLYYEKTEDGDFVREMYPVMERIIEAYRTGTDYGIHMDGDGLIMAGQGLDQVTWMDVRIGDILPTPRHGKPVEINAYWYNALRIMEHLAPLPGKEPGEYDGLAEQVKRSFTEKFWMEEKGCLKDLVSGTGADGQIRCNQIWAVSFPFTMLDEEKERKVVETVFEKLWTPCGLRTLEKDDPQFHPSYGGEMRERDMAYHQGTVWPFPLGAYYLAYLKVHGYSRAAKEKVKEQMEGLESALREGCAGQLPEIYDGAFPTVSRGCFAQAWSVGELIRVYEKLEK